MAKTRDELTAELNEAKAQLVELKKEASDLATQKTTHAAAIETANTAKKGAIDALIPYQHALNEAAQDVWEAENKYQQASTEKLRVDAAVTTTEATVNRIQGEIDTL